jgi:hypothetical protein
MRSNEPEHKYVVSDTSAMDITDHKFDEMTNLTVKMVEDLGLNTASLMPTLIVHHRHFEENGMLSDMTSTLIALDVDFSDGDEKRELLRKLGRKFYMDKEIPAAVFMASEAWMSKKVKENADDGLLPRDDPDRKEVLTIAGRTMMGECKVGVFIPVKRDGKDIMRRDGENTVFKNKNIGTFLLDEFLNGFFESTMKRFSKGQLEEMANRRNRT